MLSTIQKTIDYIEENLKSDINAEELAVLSGYSLFYFYQIFQHETGLPIMQYITRRRLIHALHDIEAGEKMIDVALNYGFNTHSGFFKAFKKAYAMSPSDYLSKHQVVSPYKINLQMETYKMKNFKQIKQILRNWELDDSVIEPVIYPNSNLISDHIWKINQEYYLKMFANEETIKKNLAILLQIKNSSTIISTKENKPYLHWHGSYYLLMHKVNGKPILSDNVLTSDKDSRLIGESIGQIHLKFKTIQGNFPETNFLKTVIDWALPKAIPYINFPENQKIDYKCRLEKIYPQLPKQLIHRDLNGANITLNNQLFEFLDFDLAEINIRLLDPCYFLTSVLSEQFSQESFKEDNWFTLLCDVLNGYDHVITLTDKEKEAMPYVIIGIQLICIAYFSEYEKYKDLLDINCQMTDWLLNNWSKLTI